MHFKNQQAFVVRGKGNVLEIKAFGVGRRADPIARNAGKVLASTPAADC